MSRRLVLAVAEGGLAVHGLPELTDPAAELPSKIAGLAGAEQDEHDAEDEDEVTGLDESFHTSSIPAERSAGNGS